MQVSIIKSNALEARRGVASATSHFAVKREVAAAVGELADIILVFQRCLLANLTRELAPGGISFSQFFLLAALRDEPGLLTMSEIAQRMGHTTAAATGLVDRLENLGHVERTHTTHDRRKVLVRLTGRGARLVARIKDDMMRNLTAILTHLNADEQKAWLAIYRKIHHICQQNPTQPS